jgi:general secretion pathway protein L
MADWLLLRLPRTPSGTASWVIADSRGNTIAVPQSGPLTLAAMRAGGRRVCVLVPGTDVLLAQPEVPVKAGAKLQQVVPYALEEQLAEDIDNLHFAIGRRVADSQTTPVAVVAQSLMDEWLTTLKSAGLKPEAMYADSDLLPDNPGHAVALIEDDAVIVRPPTGATITMPTDALTEALELAKPVGDMGERTGRGLILYTGAAEWQNHSPKVEAVRDQFDGIKVQLLTGGPLSLFAQQLPATNAINLLQGAYAQQNSLAVGWRAWRVAAFLLVALVGLHIAGKATELVLLNRAEKSLDASIDDTFRQAMPGSQNTVDARRRMEQRLMQVRGGGGASGGLLGALGAVVEARGSTPGTTVQALSFRDGALDLKMAAPNADSLDQVSRTLRANGWQADLTSGTVVESGYEGRIQMRPRGES